MKAWFVLALVLLALSPTDGRRVRSTGGSISYGENEPNVPRDVSASASGSVTGSSAGASASKASASSSASGSASASGSGSTTTTYDDNEATTGTSYDGLWGITALMTGIFMLLFVPVVVWTSEKTAIKMVKFVDVCRSQVETVGEPAQIHGGKPVFVQGKLLIDEKDAVTHDAVTNFRPDLDALMAKRPMRMRRTVEAFRSDEDNMHRWTELTQSDDPNQLVSEPLIGSGRISVGPTDHKKGLFFLSDSQIRKLDKGWIACEPDAKNQAAFEQTKFLGQRTTSIARNVPDGKGGTRTYMYVDIKGHDYNSPSESAMRVSYDVLADQENVTLVASSDGAYNQTFRPFTKADAINATEGSNAALHMTHHNEVDDHFEQTGCCYAVDFLTALLNMGLPDEIELVDAGGDSHRSVDDMFATHVYANSVRGKVWALRGAALSMCMLSIFCVFYPVRNAMDSVWLQGFIDVFPLVAITFGFLLMLMLMSAVWLFVNPWLMFTLFLITSIGFFCTSAVGAGILFLVLSCAPLGVAIFYYCFAKPVARESKDPANQRLLGKDGQMDMHEVDIESAVDPL